MLEKNFDPAEAEARIYARWEDSGAFQPDPDPAKKPYCIVIPPPNVTGSLHIGHALNNTLQDVLIRFERMRGKAVLWQAGTDHAGIATQMVVERQLMENQEPSRREMGREKFLERVWAWKEKSGDTILRQLRRLGASCDWTRTRFTMDEGLSQAVLKVFVDLHKKGLVYRDKRLVNWDPKFQTAISDLEVENLEVDGHMWHFKYPLAGGETYTYVEKDEDGNVVLEETRDYISIATTRPETMLGDGAVAVHPSDARYAPIVGKLCEIPVGPKEHRRLIPIIVDDYPDPEFGSGAVKITGGHDFNDYQVAVRNNIPKYRLMDEHAAMRSDGEPYAEAAARAQEIAGGAEASAAEVDSLNLVPEEYRGLDRFEARKKVVADIDAEGGMIEVENKKIMQPFGDRSGVVIEPMLTDQWFVDAETLAKPAIKAVEDGRTKFVPEAWTKTYYNWMRDIQPWCVSRQLWWGHRIPAWYGPDGQIFVELSEADAKAAANAHYGEDVDLEQDPDVLDTWFSSALWPFSTLGWPEKTPELERFYPTSTLVTAFDIIFFWVARMMMQGIEFMEGEVPFKDVYITPLVLDEKGQKMSKSKGNTVDPLEVIDVYGADAMRFTMASQTTQGRNLRFSIQRVEGNRNFGTKIWNAARFAQMNGVAPLKGWTPDQATLPVNRWIVGEVVKTARAVTRELEAFRFNDAANAGYRYAWNTYCDWYLELIKPVLSDGADAEKAETRACAAWAFDQLLKVLHPFIPFITEELWEKTAGEAGRDSLLIVAPWPDFGDELIDAEAADDIDKLVRLISEIRSVRSEMNVPPAEKLTLHALGADAAHKKWLTTHDEPLKRLARLEICSFEDAPKGAIQVVVDGATYALPLAGAVDVKAELARLDKDIAKVDGEISRLVKKLSNEKFVANAPDEVVAGEREKQAEYEAQKAKLDAARARLSDLG